jgi:hypothetical protein
VLTGADIDKVYLASAAAAAVSFLRGIVILSLLTTPGGMARYHPLLALTIFPKPLLLFT